jgi:hypothetical protein
MDNDFDTEAERMTRKPDLSRFGKTARRLKEDGGHNLSNRASVDWHQNSDAVCKAGPVKSFAQNIESLKEEIALSRVGESLLSLCAAGKVKIFYDEQIAISQFYPIAEGPVITLNPQRPRGELLNTLVRELRRYAQFQCGALVNPLNFEPDEAILVNRALQADVFMVSIRVAWELKLVGKEEAWNTLAGSPMADVTRIFEIKAQKDFRTLNNGDASRAAYDKFFEDCRTRLHDKRIIHQMLLDETGYIKASGTRPRVTMDFFQRLGEMPFGKNYLSTKAQRRPNDACYAAVEDRSNANFLWFVKFERSFQEKEHQLIEQSVKLSAEIVDFAKWSLRKKQ